MLSEGLAPGSGDNLVFFLEQRRGKGGGRVVCAPIL